MQIGLSTKILIILFLLLLAPITFCECYAGDPVETRYMRSDQHTINGLTAYKLGTTQTATGKQTSKTALGLLTCYWGVRVWKRSSGGTETEITSGTPVAQVSRTSDGQGIQTTTWTCPNTTLDPTDAIVVRVYTKLGTDSWQLCNTFTTEQLGAKTLSSSQWSVYYYTRRYTYNDGENDFTSASFWWGTSTYNSRIENFTWTEVPTEEWHHIIWNFTLTTRKWNHIVWNFDLLTMQWHHITWNWIIQTITWHSIIWNFAFNVRAWHHIIWQFFLGPESNIPTLFIGILFIGLIITGILIYRIRK